MYWFTVSFSVNFISKCSLNLCEQIPLHLYVNAYKSGLLLEEAKYWCF